MMLGKLKFSVLIVLLLVVTMTFVVIPGLAQDTPAETELVIVTGAVEFGANGEIIVAGTVIAPSGGFNPSSLQPGDIVIITGTFNPDGTLKAVSLELFDGEVPPEVTPEATLEITPEVTP
ncbi:MAG TPA: hypothetical protein VHO69_04080 [Phototrophicaceae bacterium]|nr:hypothetical protein [Phototrophicaceae bacterium]